jgi:hypothetical protein
MVVIGTVVAVALVIAVGKVMTSPVGAQQARACLHGTDETPEEKTRRNEAVGYTRSLHNAQAGFISVNSRYGQIAELQGVRPIPAGFAVQHAAEAKGYIFSVKDTTDQCRFTIFSDQLGIIYFAEPMR